MNNQVENIPESKEIALAFLEVVHEKALNDFREFYLPLVPVGNRKTLENEYNAKLQAIRNHMERWTEDWIEE